MIKLVNQKINGGLNASHVNYRKGFKQTKMNRGLDHCCGKFINRQEATYFCILVVV